MTDNCADARVGDGVHWSGVFETVFDSEWYLTNMTVRWIGGCGRLWWKCFEADTLFNG